MATYRPVKKWIIPIMAFIIGGSIGLALFPSSQEFHYKKWNQLLDDVRLASYKIDAEYIFNDEIALKSEGYWSKDKGKFFVSTPVSDESSFDFDIYLEKESFYVYSGGEWRQASIPHSVVEEMAPLDDPFSWVKDVLEEADEMDYEEKGNTKTYEAVFHHLNEFDFMGYRLVDQRDTKVTMTFRKNQAHSLIIEVYPIRPEDIGILQRYPEKLYYEMQFSLIGSDDIPLAPNEAREAESLD